MSPPSDGLKSLRTAADILARFTRQTPTQESGEIIRALGLSRSTGYRFLHGMIQLGFLDRDPATGQLRLGLSFIQLGHLAQEQFALVQVARPFMEELAQETQETVLLAFLRNGRAYCAEKVESTQRIRLSFDRGASLPLHAGASSKVLLAQLPIQEVVRVIRRAGLPRYTANTITSPDRLKRELAEIRRRGYAISSEEVDPGAWAISAPILGSHDGTIAGLTLSGPLQRLTRTREADWIEAVCRIAARISAKLGYVSPASGPQARTEVRRGAATNRGNRGGGRGRHGFHNP